MFSNERSPVLALGLRLRHIAPAAHPRAGCHRGTKSFSSYNPLYSLAGLLVGALIGMTGVGGGSLMTPLLVLLFGFHPATAVGTDLLYASITKTRGTAVHGKGQTSTGRSSAGWPRQRPGGDPRPCW